MDARAELGEDRGALGVLRHAGQEARTVEALGRGDAEQLEDGRGDVDEAHHARDAAAFRQSAGPAHDERHVEDARVDGERVSEVAVVLVELLAVVRGEDDEGVVLEARLREEAQHAIELRVGLGDVGVVERDQVRELGAGELAPFAVDAVEGRIARIEVAAIAGVEARGTAGRRLIGGVGANPVEPAEERALLRAHPADRLGRRHRVLVAAAREIGAQVEAAVLGRRHVGEEGGGGVAALAQPLGEDGNAGVERHAVGAHAVAARVAGGQQRGERGPGRAARRDGRARRGRPRPPGDRGPDSWDARSRSSRGDRRAACRR